MKTIRSQIAPRYLLTENKTEGILNYDADNGYPQRIMDIIHSSGIATRCVTEYAKFMEGGGFADEVFYKTIVNRKAQTLDKILAAITKDKARYNGFALHFNYNALGQITEITHVPFEYCRLSDGKNEDTKNKIAIHTDWYKQRSRQIRKDDIRWFNIFNPATAVDEAMGCGGFHLYAGQVLWVSTEGEKYPLAPLDPVLEDVESDARIKNHKRKTIATGFNADFALVTQQRFEDEAEREEYIGQLELFQGDENAGNIMLVEIDRPEQKPEILEFPRADQDKRYEYTESSIHENIRKCLGIPPVLIGEATAGKLGTSQEIIDACNFYNAITDPERRMISETFARIFRYWHVPNACPSDDYTIIPLVLFEVANENVPLAIQLGVGGTQSLTGIVTNPDMTPEQKLNTVKILFGMTTEQASAMIYGTPMEPMPQDT